MFQSALDLLIKGNDASLNGYTGAILVSIRPRPVDQGKHVLGRTWNQIRLFQSALDLLIKGNQADAPTAVSVTVSIRPRPVDQGKRSARPPRKPTCTGFQSALDLLIKGNERLPETK